MKKKGPKFRNTERDKELVRRFWEGEKAMDLCTEFNITRQRLYVIVQDAERRRKAGVPNETPGMEGSQS